MNNKVGGGFITFQYRYRKQIILVTSILLVIAGIISFVIYYSNNENEIIEETPVKKKNIKKESSEELISVDIKGEINNPGIYSLSPSSRVIDVIYKAGGLTDNADTTVINLSKKIKDEMVIIIYSKDQVNNFKETKKLEEEVQNKCISPDEESIKNDACISDATNTSGKVNINTATKQELMNLSGIGESKAKEIISYREKNGLFNTIEDIKKVSGIGDTIYAQIKENITV